MVEDETAADPEVAPVNKKDWPFLPKLVIASVLLLCAGFILSFKPPAKNTVYQSVPTTTPAKKTPTPSTVPSPTKSAAERMAGWKDYSNEKMNFTIRYPGNFLITDSQNNPNGLEAVTFEGDGLSLKFAQDDGPYIDSAADHKYMCSNVSINASQGRLPQLCRYEENGFRSYFLYNNGTMRLQSDIHDLIITAADAQPGVNRELLISDILSTLTFINPDRTTLDYRLKNSNESRQFTDPNTSMVITYPSYMRVYFNTSSYNPVIQAPDPHTDFALLITSRRIQPQSTDDPRTAYEKKDAVGEQKELESGKPGYNMDFEHSAEIINTAGINAKKYTVFARYDTCNVTFERALRFYKNGYQVIIDVVGPTDEIRNGFPQYFDKNHCWNFNGKTEPENLLQDDLKSGKGPGIAQKWYSLFDQIVGSIKFQ